MSEPTPGSEMERNIDKLGIKLAKDIVDSIKQKVKNALLGKPNSKN